MAQERPSWTTKKHHVLEDGNQLYSECQSLQQNTTIGEGVAVHRDVTREDVMDAGACWRYVKATVDSIPEAEGFEPGSDVRINQYIDVVVLYLRNNPASREQPAYYLVRTALTSAFGKRLGH
jgi:hypothetical protein